MYLVKNAFEIEVIKQFNIYIYILIFMVFNLNIIDLTIAITSWNKSYFILKKIIVPLNYIQFHYVQNSSDKNYNFHDFLSVQ